MIHLQLQPETEAQLAAEANACGLALDDYVEQIVQSRTSKLNQPQSQTAPAARSVAQAIDRIRELREETSLGGLKTRGLIDEGRRY